MIGFKNILKLFEGKAKLPNLTGNPGSSEIVWFTIEIPKITTINSSTIVTTVPLPVTTDPSTNTPDSEIKNHDTTPGYSIGLMLVD